MKTKNLKKMKTQKTQKETTDVYDRCTYNDYKKRYEKLITNK